MLLKSIHSHGEGEGRDIHMLLKSIHSYGEGERATHALEVNTFTWGGGERDTCS